MTDAIGSREATTCDFQVKTTTDKTHPEKVAFARAMLQPCGDAAGMYRCQGLLSSIDMPLCDYHRDFCINTYQWKLTKIEERKEGNDESIRKGISADH